MVSRTNKFRGRSRYHGRGKKAGRGAGKRGGRGNAGLNKHKVMTRIKYMPMHWGMHGFNRDPSLRTRHNTCNVSALGDLIGDGDSVNLGAHSIDKLLGSGQVTQAIHVTVEHASAKAVEKIESAGGSVTLSDGESYGETEEE
jgi:large subunit ribosomal protein L15